MVGDRSRGSAQQLWARIPVGYCELVTFYTDRYAGSCPSGLRINCQHGNSVAYLPSTPWEGDSMVHDLVFHKFVLGVVLQIWIPCCTRALQTCSGW
jgi:hypothetical protein